MPIILKYGAIQWILHCKTESDESVRYIFAIYRQWNMFTHETFVKTIHISVFFLNPVNSSKSVNVGWILWESSPKFCYAFSDLWIMKLYAYKYIPCLYKCKHTGTGLDMREWLVSNIVADDRDRIHEWMIYKNLNI